MSPVALRCAAAVALAAVLAVSVGAHPPSAGADPGPEDQRFLALLDAEHAPAVRNVPELIAGAHRACALLDEGNSFDAVVDRITDQSLALQPRPWERVHLAATRFVTAAVTVYCPQHTGLLPG